uniref:hypothetical protein n=1 Tax=Alistipes shahii TaxID=328814 RepID=UPI003FED561B
VDFLLLCFGFFVFPAGRGLFSFRAFPPGYFFAKNNYFFLSFAAFAASFCAPAQLRKVIPARRAESRIIHPGPDQVVVNQSFCLCATPASAQWSRRKGYVSSAKYRKKICYVQWLMP